MKARQAPPSKHSLRILFSDRGCPFAHRVLALLEHLGRPVTRRQCRIGETPQGIERYSSSGRVPLLVHGDLVLTESRVMLEHLAEYYDFCTAYPSELGARTLHRHAMALVDDYLVPLLGGRAQADAARLADTLAGLEAASATVPAHPCLYALHAAPIWLAFQSLQPQGPVVGAVRERPALSRWLDAAASLDCVVRTAANATQFAADVAHARATSVLP